MQSWKSRRTLTKNGEKQRSKSKDFPPERPEHDFACVAHVVYFRVIQLEPHEQDGGVGREDSEEDNDDEAWSDSHDGEG